MSIETRIWNVTRMAALYSTQQAITWPPTKGYMNAYEWLTYNVTRWGTSETIEALCDER